MLSALVRWLLWLVVHAIAAIRATLQRKYRNLVRRRGRPSHILTVPVPVHLALLVPARPTNKSQHLPLPQLARLLLWSLAAGVQTFTFYEPEGWLKDNEDEFMEIVEDLKVNISGEIKWNNRPKINGYKNGTNRKITVNIISLEDGKKKLLSTVRDLCRENQIDSNNLSVESVDSHIRNAYPLIPDPNLAIYCDEQCCTKGFLPWHIRLTEFLSLGELESVTREDFTDLLQRYGKCEQRFGK